MVETITLETWIGIAIAIVLFWGIASWALVRTLRQEERKVSILEDQPDMDTYSPKALAELKQFIQNNPNDPYADDATHKYNQCVQRLQNADQTFYNWSQEDIDDLEQL